MFKTRVISARVHQVCKRKLLKSPQALERLGVDYVLLMRLAVDETVYRVSNFKSSRHRLPF